MNKLDKALNLFKEWFENNEDFSDFDIEVVDKRLFCKELDNLHLENTILFTDKWWSHFIHFNRGSLYQFFDKQKIIVEIGIDYKNKIEPHFYWIIVDFNERFNPISSEKILYKNRNQAEIAVFEKAFELLNEKLNNN